MQEVRKIPTSSCFFTLKSSADAHTMFVAFTRNVVPRSACIVALRAVAVTGVSRMSGTLVSRKVSSCVCLVVSNLFSRLQYRICFAKLQPSKGKTDFEQWLYCSELTPEEMERKLKAFKQHFEERKTKVEEREAKRKSPKTMKTKTYITDLNN
jgi:hypothetical protein